MVSLVEVLTIRHVVSQSELVSKVLRPVRNNAGHTPLAPALPGTTTAQLPDFLHGSRKRRRPINDSIDDEMLDNEGINDEMSTDGTDDDDDGDEMTDDDVVHLETKEAYHLVAAYDRDFS